MATIKWIRIVFAFTILAYFDQIMSNSISYRQSEYQKLINRTIEPLPDILFKDWIPEDKIPFHERFSMLQVVDIFTVGWCSLSFLLWMCWKRKPEVLANLVAVELILIPLFAFSQWFTVIPDSLPNCLTVADIPREGYNWVWSRVSFRSCGDMLWSSDVAQLIIFTRMMSYTFEKSCCIDCCKHCSSWIVYFIGTMWTMVVVVVALAARYQYSTAMFITVILTQAVATHPMVQKFGEYLFIGFENRYRDRKNSEETRGLTMVQNDEI